MASVFFDSELAPFGDVSLFGEPGAPVLTPADFTFGVDPSFGPDVGAELVAPMMTPVGRLPGEPRFAVAPPAGPSMLSQRVEAALDTFFIDPKTGRFFDQANQPLADSALDDFLFPSDVTATRARTMGRLPGFLPIPESGVTNPPGFFETTPGKLGALLALGGAGAGMARLLAGKPGRLTLPTQAPSETVQAGQAAATRALTLPALTRALIQPSGALPATEEALPLLEPDAILAPGQRGLTGAEDLEALVRASLAGQRTLAEMQAAQAQREMTASAEQAPAERLIRRSALAGLPLFLADPPDLAPLSDTLRDLYESRLTRAAKGELPNPALERRIEQSRAQLTAQLQQQLGSQYALTTPGIQALAEFDRQAEELRENEIRATLASLDPLAQSRARFSRQFPISREQARSQIRSRGFEERLGLTGLGRVTPQGPATTLGGFVPVPPLLGIESESTRSRREALQTEAALGAFQSRETERARLSNQIASLFGLGVAFALGGGG